MRIGPNKNAQKHPSSYKEDRVARPETKIHPVESLSQIPASRRVYNEGEWNKTRGQMDRPNRNNNPG